MKKFIFFFLFSFGSLGFTQNSKTLTPEQAFVRLMEGNNRFTKDSLKYANRGQSRREALVAKQFPYAVIVGCSDSRVPPEIIFDEGLGDLFVVRVAGNVIGPLELDSIQYAILYLKAIVILVLGHENCGAVDAVINNNTKDIEDVASLISPAVTMTRNRRPNNLLEASIKANALRMKNILSQDPVLEKLMRENKIGIHAGYYHLQTGVVEKLSD